MTPFAVNDFAADLLEHLSPSGALLVVTHEANEEEARRVFDGLTEDFRADEAAIQKLREPSLTERLELDFARFEPVVEDVATPLEQWAIPLLVGLVSGPFAPLMTVGLQLACHVALYALRQWAAKKLRDAAP